jgi:hypothetical protein
LTLHGTLLSVVAVVADSTWVVVAALEPLTVEQQVSPREHTILTLVLVEQERQAILSQVVTVPRRPL